MTPEQYQEAQAAYMQASTTFFTVVVPVLGVLLAAVLGWGLGKLPGVIR